VQFVNEVISFIEAHRARYVEELSEYLAIPSVSALPEHAHDMRLCAEWTAEAMRRAGLQNVRLFETGGNPIVYGDWLGAPHKPTVLCYGHYDVQPADPLDLWTSPPFTASVRDERIYARGASDDKGQIFMHFKAVEAHLMGSGCLPVNLKVIVEGEEEVGGKHLEEFVRGNKQLLAAEAAVISDTAMFDRGVPSICCGTRGLSYFQIELRGTATDLHSGSFGGVVANPGFVLAQILAKMKGEDGYIAIPGFYRNVRPISAEERMDFERLPFDSERYREELGAPQLFGEAGFTALERLWARPTFDVNGLSAGFTGVGLKTVIPAVAMAKVSMRLVPDQDPSEVEGLFESYLNEIAPNTVDVRITLRHGAKPWAADVTHPFMRAAMRAMQLGFGAQPVFAREGGSNPILATFEDVLGLPIIMFGVGLPDDNTHAANEKLDLSNFHNGVVAAAHLYDEIGKTR
jgi:acetylornithine deacetylase/succinyl-diaminopimelate desuccinylase-like protein